MHIKKIISCVLCAALLLTFLPAPAHAVTLTAINDSILPLDESTMPARLGGETYVPYSVFTTLGVSASENDGVLDLSANDETLSFSTAEGYVYDQNLNSYSTPAYEMNGTVYVPVKLCCAKFGFTYSSLTLQGENVLRVADGSAQSDSAFIAAHTKVIENTIDNYKDNTSGSDRSNNTNTNPAPAKPVDNDTIEIPKVEEKPAKKPVRVYLAYYGAPNENTAAVLDNLHDAGRQAAFFLPTDTSKWDDDLVRRIAAEGHTAAFLLQADSKTDGADMLADLAAANERLTLLTGVAARIAANQSGSDALTEAQRAHRCRLPPVGCWSGQRRCREKCGGSVYADRTVFRLHVRRGSRAAASQQGNPETDRSAVLVYRTAGYFGRTHYIQRCAGQQCIRYPMKGELYEADLMCG